MSQEKKAGLYSFISKERIRQILNKQGNNPESANQQHRQTMITQEFPKPPSVELAKVELAAASTKRQWMLLWDMNTSKFISMREVHLEVKDGVFQMGSLPIIRVILRTESQSEAMIKGEEKVKEFLG
jgi:hypothetical protein